MSKHELSIGAPLVRHDADGDIVEYDAIVFFTAEIHGRYHRATMEQPEEWPEVEIEFVRAEFDGDEPDDAPGPITAAESAELALWVEQGAGRDDAVQAAYEAAADDGPDPDAAYDRMRDDRMMGMTT